MSARGGDGGKRHAIIDCAYAPGSKPWRRSQGVGAAAKGGPHRGLRHISTSNPIPDKTSGTLHGAAVFHNVDSRNRKWSGMAVLMLTNTMISAVTSTCTWCGDTRHAPTTRQQQQHQQQETTTTPSTAPSTRHKTTKTTPTTPTIIIITMSIIISSNKYVGAWRRTVSGSNTMRQSGPKPFSRGSKPVRQSPSGLKACGSAML